MSDTLYFREERKFKDHAKQSLYFPGKNTEVQNSGKTKIIPLFPGTVLFPHYVCLNVFFLFMFFCCIHPQQDDHIMYCPNKGPFENDRGHY